VSRLLPADLVRVGTVGVRTRRLRASLSAIGISIGIASMVAVLGVSETSKSDLLATIDRLGTNLLTVAPGQSIFGEQAELPGGAQARIRHLDQVSSASSVSLVGGATVRRSSFVPEEITGGISVQASDLQLLSTLEGEVRDGRFLSPASERYPAVVLGATAAERLGIERLDGIVQVYIGGRHFTVIGILRPLRLAPEIDSSALIGYPAAARLFDTSRSATSIYVRALDDEVVPARDRIPGTADPFNPEQVEVSRPSDALEARVAAEGAFTSLFLGLGAVALLVGGVGIANVMIISVLERRSEIGLRRALGARRQHIAAQFLAESLTLATVGGIAGVALGVAIAAGYAFNDGLALRVPPVALGGGLLAACLLGAAAGLYPALRAARLPPTEALRSV
jgi:putative ABC transport system permease protein